MKSKGSVYCGPAEPAFSAGKATVTLPPTPKLVSSSPGSVVFALAGAFDFGGLPAGFATATPANAASATANAAIDRTTRLTCFICEISSSGDGRPGRRYAGSNKLGLRSFGRSPGFAL